MAPKIRNLAVGVTVLAAMGTLAWMILKFGAAPATFFKPPQLHVTFMSDRGDGLGDGANINYLGITVGRILNVRRDPATNRIIVAALVDKDPPLPANLIADIIFTSPLGGVSSLSLQTDGPPSGQLADKAVLKARYLGSTFLPPEFTELARDLRDTVKQFNDSKVLDSLKQTVELTRERIDQSGKAIEGISSLVNDPSLRGDLKASLASIRQASESAVQISAKMDSLASKVGQTVDSTDKTLASARNALDTTQKRVDELSVSLGDQLVRLGKTLDAIQSISTKIDKGEGTAGRLVNDPKLYEALVDTTREASALAADLRRLVQQWEQEGLSFKLK